MKSVIPNGGNQVYAIDNPQAGIDGDQRYENTQGLYVSLEKIKTINNI